MENQEEIKALNEKKVIRMIALFNRLKTKINQGYENKYYQEWSKGKKAMKFRDYVIEKHKTEAIKILDAKE